MATQKGLGKGLGALFGDINEQTETPAEGAVSLPLQKIEPNPLQPRKTFDPDELASLAESIRMHGIIQPLTVRKLPSGFYQIIAGERRWRAARLAGLSDVPVVIIEADDKKAMELALIENLQRADLNPIEEALGYQELMGTYEMTQEQAAARQIPPRGRKRAAFAEPQPGRSGAGEGRGALRRSRAGAAAGQGRGAAAVSGAEGHGPRPVRPADGGALQKAQQAGPARQAPAAAGGLSGGM